MLTISFVLLAVHAPGALAAPSTANGQGGLRIPISKRQLGVSANGTVSLDVLGQTVGFMEAYVSFIEFFTMCNLS